MKSSLARTSLTWGDLKKWLKSKFFIDISKACSTEGEEKNTRLQVRLAPFPLKPPNDIQHGLCQVRNHPGLRRGRGNSAQGCKLQVRLLGNKPAGNSKLVHKCHQHICWWSGSFQSWRAATATKPFPASPLLTSTSSPTPRKDGQTFRLIS